MLVLLAALKIKVEDCLSFMLKHNQHQSDHLFSLSIWLFTTQFQQPNNSEVINVRVKSPTKASTDHHYGD